MKMWLRVRAFINAVRKEVLEGHNVAILYENGSTNSGKVFREMRDPAFRARCLKLLDGNPWVVCYRFSPPDSYDDWTFAAYPKPRRIEPGHCVVCNHHAIRNNRCQNISCEAVQRPELAPIDIG